MLKLQIGLSTSLAFMLLSAVPGRAATVFATNASGSLLTFNSSTPNNVTTIGSLGINDPLIGIDFRPANNVLYGAGASGQLYTINTTTGLATQFGAALSLNGTFFGFDFNPMADRIRITSNNDQNLRIVPDTGVLAMSDMMLAYAAGDVNAGANPNVSGSAYTNSVPAAASTTLYNIDYVLGILVTQVPPNNGTLNTVGSLGLGMNLNPAIGFDIAAPGDQAFASIRNSAGSSTTFYSINLGTGAATSVGAIGSNQLITGLAVAPVPEPGTIALVAFGIAGSLYWRRKKNSTI